MDSAGHSDAQCWNLNRRLQSKKGGYRGDSALSTANWRRFARQSGGIMTILLLVLSLAFRVHACPMLADVDPALPDTHDCCHDTAATPDTPGSSTPLACHDGPCLQALSDHDGFSGYLSLASEPAWSALTLVAEWLPPDWSGQRYFPPPLITASGPPPLQRSLILRL